MVTIVILIIQAQPTVYLKTQGVCLKVHVYTHLNRTLCRSAFQLYCIPCICISRSWLCCSVLSIASLSGSPIIFAHVTSSSVTAYFLCWNFLFCSLEPLLNFTPSASIEVSLVVTSFWPATGEMNLAVTAQSIPLSFLQYSVCVHNSIAILNHLNNPHFQEEKKTKKTLVKVFKHQNMTDAWIIRITMVHELQCHYDCTHCTEIL